MSVPTLEEDLMSAERDVRVHLLPDLAAPETFAGSVAVVIDVLRATTTIVHALAAGCTSVYPCLEVEEARRLADSLPAGKVLLAGERQGKPLEGFDLGNSPGQFTPQTCRDLAVVLTTTNGTRALIRAAGAARVLVAAFVNYSAVCEQLRVEARWRSVRGASVCGPSDMMRMSGPLPGSISSCWSPS
jgi:2-phosphosulfolactate phosphatase